MKLVLVSYMLPRDGQIPIGLLTLASIAREEGIEDVAVVDLPEHGTEDDFIARVAGSDLVGFSSICSTYNQTVRLCRRLKAASPGTAVVLGGPQATLTAHASLVAFPFIDMIFLGEAERAWRQFLRNSQPSGSSLEGIAGVMWRSNGSIKENRSSPVVRDLSTLPLPSLDLYAYAGRGGVTPIEIGRGCPFACSFCSSSPYFGRVFRLKPVDRILREMDLLYEHYGSRIFYFVQDSFSVRQAFVQEICAAIKAHHRRYAWYCSARLDQVCPDLLATMKDAGCQGIYFGLETGSQRMQKVINKNLNVTDALELIRQAAGQRFEVTTSMIIGFPQETRQDLRETVRAFLKLKASGQGLVQLHILAPMTGSSMIGEGHLLAYDGMPSDFSDTAHVIDAEDRSMIQRYSDIFSNFWYYVNPAISRSRYLFLAHLLTTASLRFPNTLCLAARQACDALCEWLLDQEVVPNLCSDPETVGKSEAWVIAAADFFERFIQHAGLESDSVRQALSFDRAYSLAEVAQSPRMAVIRLPSAIGVRPGRVIYSGLEQGGELASYVVQRPEAAVEVFQVECLPKTLEQTPRRMGIEPPGDSASEAATAAWADVTDAINELCSKCGECCFAPGGILCGADEWPDIRAAMTRQRNGPPQVRQLHGCELLVVDQHRDMACDMEGKGSAHTRRACPALLASDGGWRCSIERVKPAGCIAYPLKLVLRGNPKGPTPCLISLDFDGSNERDACPLGKALRSSRSLLNEYREHVGRRVGVREGAFELALYNSQRSRPRGV